MTRHDIGSAPPGKRPRRKVQRGNPGRIAQNVVRPARGTFEIATTRDPCRAQAPANAHGAEPLPVGLQVIPTLVLRGGLDNWAG